MNTAALSSSTVNGVSSQSIDDLLDELDLDVAAMGGNDIEEIVAGDPAIEDDTVVEEVVASAEPDADDGLNVDELEMGIERAEGYQAQDTGAPIATTTPNKPGRKKKEATAAATAAPKAPRQPRELTAIEASTFVLEGDAADMTPAELEQNKLDVIAEKPTQKKIAEKYENLFQAISVGKQPSVYVVQAFKLLDSKKELNATDIVALLKANSYSPGTAQSQAGQIMKLFEVTKIAARNKNALAINDNSVVAAKLRKIIEDAAKAA